MERSREDEHQERILTFNKKIKQHADRASNLIERYKNLSSCLTKEEFDLECMSLFQLQQENIDTALDLAKEAKELNRVTFVSMHNVTPFCGDVQQHNDQTIDLIEKYKSMTFSQGVGKEITKIKIEEEAQRLGFETGALGP